MPHALLDSAEYYQDITFAATKTQRGFRMIVDVLDALTIGERTAIPGNAAERVKFFTETLVLGSPSWTRMFGSSATPSRASR